MLLKEAEKFLKADYGFLVCFERVEGVVLASDYVPDVEVEEPFRTEEDAIAFGLRLAAVTTGKFVNFYIVRSDNYKPFGDWQLENR